MMSSLHLSVSSLRRLQTKMTKLTVLVLVYQCPIAKETVEKLRLEGGCDGVLQCTHTHNNEEGTIIGNIHPADTKER